MNNPEIDYKKIAAAWLVSSDEDYDTMITMFENKKYNWSLFIGHLLIEKLLKALFASKIQLYPPYIHNLFRLAELCELELTEAEKTFFITVTAFNINARYDDYKLSFYKKCTPEYSHDWLEKIKYYRIWIKEQIEI